MRYAKRRLITSGLAMLLGVALAGCGESPSDGDAGRSSGGPLKIAVIPKATNHEFWKSIHAGAVKAERELDGVQITWKGPAKEDDREQQINVVENFISAGVAGIVLAPLDDVALVKPVREATRAGIPVVIMDSGLQADPGTDYVSYVATDNEAGGRKAARHMGGLLDGRGKVLVLRYQEGSASTMRREQGFLDELAASFPDIELVSGNQYAGATTAEALDKAETLLSRFDQLDGAFGACEPVISGILGALEAAGRIGQVKVVGFDTSAKLVKAMEAGHLHGLVLQDPINIGYLGVRTLVEHLHGEPVEARIDTGSVLATPQNMNEPGIRERLFPPFEKYLQ